MPSTSGKPALERVPAAAASPAEGAMPAPDIIVRSAALQRVLALVERVARHPAAVLITGETGTGKEMIARAIHGHSMRCHQQMIEVNCAAIPEHLVESELFGYEKGAFSGADSSKPGFFELADKGTLFLDEIGEIEQKIQVKLLRVLDGVPYYRLGGSKKVVSDVRIIAATNQDLEVLVAQGRFRGDLYHRLAQFKLFVPPLRERHDDLLAIAESVLHHHFPKSAFTDSARDALLSYAWPGNVRELKNIVFRAVLQGKNPEVEITAEDLSLSAPKTQAMGVAPALDGDLENIERQVIMRALERNGGNQGKAAQELGISRRTLLRKLKAFRSQEAGPELFGTLTNEQQRYYRAETAIPSVVRCKGRTADATIQNISLGGAAIQCDDVLPTTARVELEFTFPGTDKRCHVPGVIVWSEPDNRFGVQFTEVSPEARTNLQRWLHERMKTEGWGS